jgi:hypothetical protein
MPPILRRRNDIHLILNRPSPQQRLPVRLSRWNRERGRIHHDLRTLPPQPQRHLREAQVEADHHAKFPDRGVDWREDLPPGLDAVALFQHGASGAQVDVEEVDFLVAGRYGAVLVDPDQCVLYFGAALGRFVDADVDGEIGGARFVLQAEDEGAGGGGLDEGEGLRGRGGYVVGCFGEEEGLS